MKVAARTNAVQKLLLGTKKSLAGQKMKTKFGQHLLVQTPKNVIQKSPVSTFLGCPRVISPATKSKIKEPANKINKKALL